MVTLTTDTRSCGHWHPVALLLHSTYRAMCRQISGNSIENYRVAVIVSKLRD